MAVLMIIVRSLLSIVMLFIIARVLGKRQIAQLSFFDYVTGITLGSIAAVLAADDSLELYKPLIGLVVFGAITLTISIVTDKSILLRRFLNGDPVILIYKGVLQRENMKKVKFDISDLQMECRAQGYFNMSDIYFAVMEAYGKLSILPKCAAAPPTAADMNIAAKQQSLQSNVIMDGNIMRRNLKAMGKDESWLMLRLQEQGFAGPENILLATLEEDDTVSIFIKENAKSSKTILE